LQVKSQVPPLQVAMPFEGVGQSAGEQHAAFRMQTAPHFL
jgi:hypothetical protein